MAPTKVCIAKLKKELKAILQDPPPYIPAVAVGDASITTWHFLLRGPPDTPYEGGWYVGKLRFDDDYPFSPPNVYMVTPNGRFATGTAICVDGFTAFHAWNPSWSVATILKGFLSFMCDDDPTTGGLAATPAQRRALAAASLDWNVKAPGGLAEMFPVLARAAAGEDVGDGSGGGGGGGGGDAGAAAAAAGTASRAGPEPAASPPAPEPPEPAAAAEAPPPPPPKPLRVSAADLATIVTAAAEAAAGDGAAAATRLDKAVRKHRKKGDAPPADLLLAAARAVASGAGDLARAASLAGEAAGAADAPAGAAQAAAAFRSAAAALEAGSAAAAAGDFDAAVAAFDRVLGGAGTACSAARVGRAAALAARGDAAAAADAYAAARAADAGLGVEVLRAHAAALREAGRGEEAGRVEVEGGVGVGVGGGGGGGAGKRAGKKKR